MLRRRLVQSALGAPRRVIVRHQFADERDQFLAILNRVRSRIITADQLAGRTELVVFEHRFRDRLGGADKRCRVPLRTGRDRERCPQACVVHLRFRGGLQ